MRENYKIDGGRLAAAIGLLQQKLNRKVTQREFANMVGVSGNTISCILLGKSPGCPETARKIIRVLRANHVVITHEYLTQKATTPQTSRPS